MLRLALFLLLLLPLQAEEVRVLIGYPVPAEGPAHEVLPPDPKWRGRLEVFREKGKAQVINFVDLEDYLCGVVPRELMSDQLEAEKAQAVVARTYALAHLRPGKKYDVTATDKSQVYGGVAAEQPITNQAVEETRGQVLLHEGKLAKDVLFSSTCGGSTVDKERVYAGLPVPYLKAVACTFCEASPLFRWQLEVEADELRQELERSLGKPVQPLTALAVAERDPSGRVQRLRLQGAEAAWELRGDDMRRHLFGRNEQGQRKALYSTRFEVEERPGGFCFRGQGWGHGVGMCQWGALGQARQGKNYRDILAYYFSGTRVSDDRSGRHIEEVWMLYQKGQAVYNEINDQPRLWRETLNRLAAGREAIQGWLRGENFGQVVYLGCGSAYNVAMTAARVTHRVSGLNSIALSSSEMLFLNRPPYDPRIKTLLIPMSRLGETAETNWAVEKLRKMNQPCKALSLTVTPGTLGTLCDQNFKLDGCEEFGQVATKSATCMLLTSIVLACFLAQGKADALLHELNTVPEKVDPKVIADRVRGVGQLKPQPQHAAFLGSGPYLGIAAEGSLKMREMVGIPCEYQQPLEYRHGSHCGLTNLNLVVAVQSDTLRGLEEDSLTYIAQSRAPRFVLTEEATQAIRRSEYVVELKTGLTEITRMMPITVYLQLMSYYLAIAKGLNPDKPKLLETTLTLKDKPAF